MPMLHACPRCTQALAETAKFCRRCGAAVGESAVSRVPNVQTKPRSLLTAGLSALLLGTLVFAGFSYWTISQTPTTLLPVPDALQNQAAYPEQPAHAYPSDVPIVVADPGSKSSSGFSFSTQATHDTPDHSRDHRAGEHQPGR